MSKAFKDWSMETIRQCIKECVRPGTQPNNVYVVNNDPYGLCLNRYKSEKGNTAPVEYRQYLLTEIHNTAQHSLRFLKDPDEVKRCQEIINKTESDNRALSRKYRKRFDDIAIDFD